MRRLLPSWGLFAAMAFSQAGLGQNASDLAQTPPMGWNSWNRFGCNINEELIRSVAAALVSSGMRDLGYRYVNIDDCWQIGRRDDGTIVVDPERFPSGMAALADAVHAQGLKLGIYTDAGRLTCQGRPGSYGYEALDARTYASWGVDYVKTDWCAAEGLDAPTRYQVMGEALRAAGRPMVFSICNWGVQETALWAPQTGHLWRTTNDISDTWDSALGILDLNAKLAAVAGPGHWNDPDMLEVGNGGMTADEYRAHFSLWAMMAAPLIAGNDIRTMTQETKEILLNAEVVAVNQDALGLQGVRIRQAGELEVWLKPLQVPGERAVLLLNRSAHPAALGVQGRELGLTSELFSGRDLWAHRDLGLASEVQAVVPPHGAVMVKVSGVEAEVPAGVHELSALPWLYGANYWGPIKRNLPNGQEGEGPGLSLNGKHYATGLGVHAPSHLRYALGGRCHKLQAVVGLDDEVAALGAVIFEVWADGQNLFRSERLDAVHRSQELAVELGGRRYLDLVVRGAGTSFDFAHADWVEAELDCAP